MASLSEATVSVLSSAASSREMDDGRGFVTGGIEHPAPDFGPTSPSKRAWKKKTSKMARARPLPRPVVAVSPEDLDLEDTLVAGDSFLSSGSGSQGGSGLAAAGGSSMSGNSTSYSRAVIKGRLDTSYLVWQVAAVVNNPIVV